ncbi:MAG: hypothetical protein JO157_14620 [Acetobacteraceae bacterium]|nr:hypothetical protein [Acetobacteraceae bacterium]
MQRYVYHTATAAMAATLLLLGAPPAATAQITAAAGSDPNLRGSRTGDLAALCGASEQDPARQAALAYCEGFFVAAGQYHRALTAQGGVDRPIFCLPNPSPTFDQARTSFVAWARANPQYTDERAIDGLMRFAAETYPCPAAPAPAARRSAR